MGRPMPGWDVRSSTRTRSPSSRASAARSACAPAPTRTIRSGTGTSRRTSEETFGGEWFHTKDAATGRGRLRLVRRSRRRRDHHAGYRIGPFEVESACLEHPAVPEAAAVASPDERRGNVVKAFVVLAGLRPTDELAGRSSATSASASRPTPIRARSSSSTTFRRPDGEDPPHRAARAREGAGTNNPKPAASGSKARLYPMAAPEGGAAWSAPAHQFGLTGSAGGGRGPGSACASTRPRRRRCETIARPHPGVGRPRGARQAARRRGGRARWWSASRSRLDLRPCATRELVVEAMRRGKRGDPARPSSRLERHALGPDAILASNTSSIPIAQLAAATQGPERVLGLHFFSPVPVMKLVEVVVALDTSEETVGARRGVRRGDRQARDPHQGPLGLHRQHAARPLPDGGGADVRRRLRHAEDIDEGMGSAPATRWVR